MYIPLLPGSDGKGKERRREGTRDANFLPFIIAFVRS